MRLYCHLLGLLVPLHFHFPVPVAWQYATITAAAMYSLVAKFHPHNSIISSGRLHTNIPIIICELIGITSNIMSTRVCLTNITKFKLTAFFGTIYVYVQIIARISHHKKQDTRIHGELSLSFFLMYNPGVRDFGLGLKIWWLLTAGTR